MFCLNHLCLFFLLVLLLIYQMSQKYGTKFSLINNENLSKCFFVRKQYGEKKNYPVKTKNLVHFN